MTIVNDKRARTLSPISVSDDDDHRGKPKTHEDGRIGGKMQNLEENKAGDPVVSGLNSNACLVCDGKDNWVLVCHGEECPLAIHQTCASDEPDFDEFGNFYCPYCWYKRIHIKFVKLQKKLMITERSTKGRGVGLALVTQETESAAEVVSGGRITTTVNSSGHRRKCDDANKKRMVMGKSQEMKAATVQTHFLEISITDVDEERQQKGRFSEKIYDACNSNLGEGRMQQRINHGTTLARCSDASVKSRNQRIYNQLNAGTHGQDCFTNDHACNSGLGEGKNGQACCHENSQQKEVFCAHTCDKEVPKNDNRVSHGSELEEGSHVVNNKPIKTMDVIHKKAVSKNQERKRKRAVARDGDEFYSEEDEDKQCQVNMKKDDERENGFRKDEQVERNPLLSVSSPMSSDHCNKSNAASQELAMIIHPTAGVHKQPIDAQPYCSIPSKKLSFQPEKYGHKSYHGTASNDHGQRNFVLCNEKKRKRQLWTQAEEEMLRVGVQKFPGVRNIPWRKILDFGRDVFHDDRVPSDLKDKWKNLNKMSVDTGKWVSLSTEGQPNHSVSETSR